MRTSGIKEPIYRMLTSDRGATALEYGLIVALITVMDLFVSR